MNILYIGINNSYFNPSCLLTPKALDLFANVTRYGPGFSSRDLLSKGLDEFSSKNSSDFDFIFIHSNLIIDLDYSDYINWLSSYTYLFPNHGLTESFFDDVKRFCSKHKHKVICSVMDLDIYLTQQPRLDAIDKSCNFIMTWGSDIFNTLTDADLFHKENYLNRKLKLNNKLEVGLFDNFVDENSHRVINLGHFVADHEFFYGDVKLRPFDIVTPGTPYYRREKFNTAIKNTKHINNYNDYIFLKYVIKVLSVLKLKPFAKKSILSLYNSSFSSSLFRSKAAYTDGGITNFPIRKFFEIPAAGCALICSPFLGIEKLGFNHMESYISLSRDDNPIDVLDYLLSNPDLFSKIATNGQIITRRNHSLYSRANQLESALQQILLGKFKGSTWRSGNFELLK